MKSRRELLKLFGVGTIIAPIAANAVQAKLIEVPKIEIVKSIPQNEPLDMQSVESIEVTVNLFGGGRRTLQSTYLYGRAGNVPIGKTYSLYVFINEEIEQTSPPHYGPLAHLRGDIVLL